MCTDDKAQLVLFTALDTIEYVRCLFFLFICRLNIILIKRHKANLQISCIINNFHCVYTKRNSPRLTHAVLSPRPMYPSTFHPSTNCYSRRQPKSTFFIVPKRKDLRLILTLDSDLQGLKTSKNEFCRFFPHV